jgi:hypothetical protein
MGQFHAPLQLFQSFAAKGIRLTPGVLVGGSQPATVAVPALLAAQMSRISQRAGSSSAEGLSRDR